MDFNNLLSSLFKQNTSLRTPGFNPAAGAPPYAPTDLGAGGALPQPSQPPNPDAEMQAARLDRRQKLLEALSKQLGASSQGQMVGQHFVGSPLGALVTPLLQSTVLNKQSEELDAQRVGLQKTQQEDLQRSLEGVMRRRAGGGEGVMTDAQAGDLLNGDKPPEFSPMQPNPQGALAEALSSKFPQMQELGKLWAKNDYAPEKVDEGKTYKFGGKVVQVKDGVAREVGDFSSPGKSGTKDVYTEGSGWRTYEVSPDGKVDLQKPLGGFFQKKAGVAESSGLRESSAEKELGKNRATSLFPGGKSYEAAKTASQGLISSSEAASALARSAKTGIAQPALQFARRLAAELGQELPATADTAQLDAVLKDGAIKDLGGLGNQISDADRTFVVESQGSISTDPTALKRILAIRIARQIMEVDRHNNAVSNFARQQKDPGLEAEGKVSDLVRIQDPEMKKMVGNVLMGRATVEGIQPKTSATTPSSQGRTPSGAVWKNWNQ